MSESDEWVTSKLSEKETTTDIDGDNEEQNALSDVLAKPHSSKEIILTSVEIPTDKNIPEIKNEGVPKVPLLIKENLTQFENEKNIVQTQLQTNEVKVDSSNQIDVANESEVTTSVKPREIITAPVKIEQKVIRLFKPPPKEVSHVKEIRTVKANEVTSSVEDRKTYSNDPNEIAQHLDANYDRSETDTTTTDDDRLWIDTEEDDEQEGRLNPKTCVERANNAAILAAQNVPHPQHGYPQQNNQQGQYHRPPMNHHRGGGHFGPRGVFPMRPQYQPHHPNNTLQPPIYHSQGGGGVYHPPSAQHGAEYRPPLPQFQNPGIRPPQPFTNFGHPHPRPPRPELHPNQNAPFRPFNALIVRQVGHQQIGPGVPHLRPRAPLPPPNQQPTPYIQNIPGQCHFPPQQLHPRHPQIHIPQQIAQQAAPPRKILLNPNFKHGGTEAAKSQLLMDTFLNPTFNSIPGGQSDNGNVSAQSEDQLLRLQEAFINQNRMHIEKRRYDRSPERGRDRDYSPPPSRRERRPHSRDRDWHDRGRGDGGRSGNYRGNERRRANNEQYDHGESKRRRSESMERDEKMNVVSLKS